MIARVFSVALALVFASAAPGFAQTERSPMRDVAAALAVDGIVVVSQSAELPFTLRIAGGDAKRTVARDGQLWIPVGEHMFQVTLASITQVLPNTTKIPAEREVLKAHAAWECDDHNQMLHLTETPKPEFSEIGGRTWCHWTYDLSSIAAHMTVEQRKQAQGPGPQTQHLLSAVLGKNILVLVGTTLVGQKEEDTQAGLLNTAKTLALYPKPLTQKQIEELCSHPQP